MTDKDYFTIHSIVKTMRLLEALVSQKGFDLVELTRLMGYPKTTVHRMLLTLKSLGYVKQNRDSRRYSATIKLFQLGHCVLENNDLFTTAQPIIEVLSAETGESVYVLIRDQLDVVVIAKATGSYSLRQDEQIGFRYAAYNSASGRVLLAHLAAAERRRLFRGHRLRPTTPQSPTRYAQLEERLEPIARQGYAVEHEEYNIGLSCIAAPVLDHKGNVTAALTVSGPTVRLKADLSKLIPKVKKASRDISRGLGFTF